MLHPLSALLTGESPPRAAANSLQPQLECCLADTTSPHLQLIGQAIPILHSNLQFADVGSHHLSHCLFERFLATLLAQAARLLDRLMLPGQRCSQSMPSRQSRL